MEDKALPELEEVELARNSSIISPKNEQTLVPDTQSLLKEFENVFDAVEMNHGTLTPPQSPPYKPLFTTLEPVGTQILDAYPEKQALYPDSEKQFLNEVLGLSRTLLDFQSVATPQADVAHELAVVDELIRTRAEDLIQYPSSPGSNSENSSFGDSSDDPEWLPEPVEQSLSTLASPVPKLVRKRSKPYTRTPPEEKKSRKKEQNKNAATRYRMKKKAEVEEILEEERLLSQQNDGLECNITDLQREIKYLKGLMRDLFKAKGLIN